MVLMCTLQKVEQQLQQSQSQLEEAQKQLAAAAALAEARLKEKAAADKEWADRLAAKEQEAGGKLKDAEAKLKDLEDRGAQLLQQGHVCCLLGCDTVPATVQNKQAPHGRSMELARSKLEQMLKAPVRSGRVPLRCHAQDQISVADGAAAASARCVPVQSACGGRE